MSQYTLIKNADVKVQNITSRNATHAHIIINDEHEHTFPTTSRVSKHLDLMEPAELATRLSGGTYFLLDDADSDDKTLVDFRDGSYDGFVHDTSSIDKFMEILGVSKRDLSVRPRAEGSQYKLSKTWSDSMIEVPGYQDGGVFKSELIYAWNPFVRTINTSFRLMRMICENGMMGMADFMNARIPVVNRWEENLDISKIQIQNRVNDLVISRVQQMSHERASVAHCLLIEDHITERMNAPQCDTRDKLVQLLASVSPTANLGTVYRDTVFDNKQLAAQLPAHLTAFDAWNITTELSSHTSESSKSSTVALDRLANVLLMDKPTSFDKVKTSALTTRPTASFADAERAFYSVA